MKNEARTCGGIRASGPPARDAHLNTRVSFEEHEHGGTRASGCLAGDTHNDTRILYEK